MLKKWINKYQELPVQVRASAWFLICAFMQKGISAVTTPIFTRLLTTTEYGQYSVFDSWLRIVTVFVSFNLSAGVYIQGMVKFEEQRKKYASAIQGLSFTLIFLWTIIYISFHDFWNNLLALTTVQMLAMFLMIWTSSVYNFWSVGQRMDFRYRKLVFVTLLVSFAKPVLGIFFVLHAEDRVTARILGLAFVELVAYSGFFFSEMYKGKTFFDWKIWKYAFLFNLPLLPHYLSGMVLNSADRIMISRMVGEDTAGIYSLAYSVSLIMTMFNTALLQTIEPWLYKKIKSNQLNELSKVAYPTFIIIAGVNIVMIAFAPEIVAVFAPPEYYDAIYVIPPVAMSGYFMFAYSFFAAFEFYYEKTGYISIATVVGAVANIILNYVFIRIFGYYAAGYTTLFCYILYAVFHYCFMRKLCHEFLGYVQIYSAKILLAITAGFMILGFLLLFTYQSVILRYSIIVVLAACLVIWRKKLILIVRQIIFIRNSKDGA